MKKILYICSEAAPGMIPYATSIIQSASKSRFLDVFAITVDDDKLSYRPLLKDFLEDKIHFLQIPQNKVSKYLNKIYARDILYKVKKICKTHKIDVIHLLTVDYTCATILPQLKKLCEVYYTIHDLVPHEKAHTSFKEHFFTKYLRWGVKSNIRNSDCLVTNSKHQYRLIKKVYTDKNIYFHTFPPLITNTILSGEKVCPEIKNIDKYVFFFGNIDKYKGVEYLYEAFENNENLQEYKLVIAGKGAIYFPYKDNPRIILINRYIEDEEIKMLFTKASCVVYPYISATQSGVLTFAYKFQTPAIVSDIPFFREVSNEKSCLFFKRADTKDLSKKLEILLFNTNIEEMKAAQKTFFENNYSEIAVISSIECIY